MQQVTYSGLKDGTQQILQNSLCFTSVIAQAPIVHYFLCMCVYEHYIHVGAQ